MVQALGCLSVWWASKTRPTLRFVMVPRMKGPQMQLGFVTAILPDLKLEEVFTFAADEGFDCIEVMCWPPGGSERRYAGITHLDVSNFTDDHAGKVRDLVKKTGVAMSG